MLAEAEGLLVGYLLASFLSTGRRERGPVVLGWLLGWRRASWLFFCETALTIAVSGLTERTGTNELAFVVGGRARVGGLMTDQTRKRVPHSRQEEEKKKLIAQC